MLAGVQKGSQVGKEKRKEDRALGWESMALGCVWGQHSRGKLALSGSGLPATNLYASGVSRFSKYNRTSATLKISSHRLLKTIILYFLSCF